MFTPREGRRVYNPFGGGVQFGFVAGASGYQYLASEIRQNQCDANNALCAQFEDVKWEQGDSSTYSPDGQYDLVFACPPYYRVEKYIDYDGNPPEGEINHLPTYEAFRDTLFSGYRRAIEHLADNRFIVIMTGDSRDSKGGYHCHEAETELFFKDAGLTVYNKIVYLEAEFTRLAQAKKTLNFRKYPKREQRIIVAYKGKVSEIAKEFAPVGRL
jgi:DNA modification methylase